MSVAKMADNAVAARSDEPCTPVNTISDRVNELIEVLTGTREILENVGSLAHGDDSDPRPEEVTPSSVSDRLDVALRVAHANYGRAQGLWTRL